jgi:hypothetical protein
MRELMFSIACLHLSHKVGLGSIVVDNTGLKMNQRKYAFGVSTDKFLGFIIHEHGIEIDPDRNKSIRNVGALTCKLEMQKFLGKINYLWSFISNLAGKFDAFTPILQPKNHADFTWGQNIKKLLIILKTICLRLQC